MKAAVVTAFDRPPQYDEFPTPTAERDNQMVVDVLASGLHPRVRSQANGSHYTSTTDLPLVPGVDGVGRGPDGVLRYFILSDTTRGAMAEKTLIDTRRSVALPAGADVAKVAAAMNPAMSSWIALQKRISFQAGQRVLILGATGNAGRMAVSIAHLLGAAKVVAVGRRPDEVAALTSVGATDTVVLNRPDTAEALGALAADVDVVIDYLWGEPTADALRAIIPSRADDSQQLSWIQIGSVAGPTSPIPSAALRAAKLQIVGSGQGSVSPGEILSELPSLAELITNGKIQADAREAPLRDVEQAWTSDASSSRVVLTP